MISTKDSCLVKQIKFITSQQYPVENWKTVIRKAGTRFDPNSYGL
jgi:hypothetical protein